MILIKSKAFWTLLVGVVAFAARWYWPTFPLTEGQILSLVFFVLGFFQIYPSLRASGLRAFTSPPIYSSLAFLELVAGLAAFVIQTLQPGSPVTKEMVLMAFALVLGLLGVSVELRERGLI